MGGGNGNKAMLTRERNAKKAQAQKKGGVNQKEAAQKAMTLVCQICRTQFMNTCECRAASVWDFRVSDLFSSQ